MILSVMQTKTRLLLGDITTGDYSDSNLLRSLNDHIHAYTVEAIMASGEWRVQGEIATTNLVASQAEYSLPANIITIERIEMNLTGGTNTWETVWTKDDRNIQESISNGSNISSSPTIYLHDNSIFFEDPPANNVTNGLKVWYSTEPTELSASGDEPILPEFSHVGLIYGACMDYWVSMGDMNKETSFYRKYLEVLQRVREYYANRTKITRPRITTRNESYC